MGNTDKIEYIDMATLGNAADFGNLQVAGDNYGGASNDTRALFAGGYTGSGVISTVLIATPQATADDYGDLIDTDTWGCTGLADATRAVFGGGNDGSDIDTIQYMAIASTGTAYDFGDLVSGVARNKGACANSTRGVFAGGYSNAVMDVITIQTTSTVTDFGDLIDSISDYGGISGMNA